MTVKFQIEGGKELVKKFAEISQKATNAAEQGLVRGGLLVERDAKKNCPVDTGRLRASISHRLIGAGTNSPVVEVGTNVEYAKFVELGTSRMAAKPFLFPALTANSDRIKQEVANAIRKELGL